ncbi:MAG: acyl carrier protein [Melioribacteraceae bacterium]
MNIENELILLISQFFQKNMKDINLETTQNDIEEWDSLEHIKLVLEIESKFGVRFPLEIIPKLTSVKNIVEELKKLKNNI